MGLKMNALAWSQFQLLILSSGCDVCNPEVGTAMSSLNQSPIHQGIGVLGIGTSGMVIWYVVGCLPCLPGQSHHAVLPTLHIHIDSHRSSVEYLSGG
jgi:hypothetical protein